MEEKLYEIDSNNAPALLSLNISRHTIVETSITKPVKIITDKTMHTKMNCVR